MELKPVRKYRTPVYPQKEEVVHNPAILKCLPQRWKGNVTVGVAFSALLALTLSACGNSSSIMGGNNSPTTGNVLNGNSSNETTDGNRKEILKDIEVPLFIHGDGRGSFGCVSVAPPAFLSEEEAFQVISEEMEREGVKLQKDALELKRIEIPVTDINYNPGGNESTDKDGIKNYKTKKGDITLDGYDSAVKIGYEFVSSEDVKQWHKNGNVVSTVETYETLRAASTLNEGIKDSTEGSVIGIFYDPMVNPSDDMLKDKKTTWVEKEKIMKEMASEQLREQVRDFLQWLKAQGIV